MKISRIRKLAALLLLLVAPLATHAAEPTDPTQHYVGIGINAPVYWDGLHICADVVRSSMIGKAGGPWNKPASTDANGWPNEDMSVSGDSAMAGGTYKIVFTGQAANISANRGSIANKVYNSVTNQTTADWIIPAGGFYQDPTAVACYIDFTGTKRTAASATNTGITNLRIWRPGYATNGSALFTNEYLAALQKFHLLRGMDYMNTNGNPSITWSDRSLMSFAGEMESDQGVWSLKYHGPDPAYAGKDQVNAPWFYPQGYISGRGAPWELLVQMANASNCDLWINVPVLADDTYLTKLAQLMKYGSDGVNPYTSAQANPVYPPLNSNLKLYIEYGNEIWNSGPGFHCFDWVLYAANAVRNNATHPICYDGVQSDQYIAMYRYIAWRSSVISLTFRSVFGDAAMMTRVRPILSSQVGGMSGLLPWAEGFYGAVRSNNAVIRKPSELWYGGGGAAYYDSDAQPYVLDANNNPIATPQMMTDYFNGLPSAGFAGTVANDARWCRAYGLKLTAYEGGPGPGGSALGGVQGDAVSPQYNADPRMKDRMQIAQDTWIATGGDLLTYFCLSGDGPWGFTDYTSQLCNTNTVKLQGMDLIRGRPKTAQTFGTLVPETIPLSASASAVQSVNGASLNGATGRVALNANSDRSKSDAVIVPFRAPVAASYDFQVTYTADNAATVELLVEGNSIGTWSLPAASTETTSSVLSASLPAGLAMARVRVLTNSVSLGSLIVKSPAIVETPAFTPAAGWFTSTQTVAISCATPGASIRYTLDGSAPTASSALYTAPLTISTTTTLRAIASKPGLNSSNERSGVFTIAAAAPTLSPASGVYANAQSVTLSTATAGATIYYTTDGSQPTTSSPVYSGPITVASPTIVKAIAVKTGLTSSLIARGSYTIAPTADVIINDTFSGSGTTDIAAHVPEKVQTPGDTWDHGNQDPGFSNVTGGVFQLGTAAWAKSFLAYRPVAGVQTIAFDLMASGDGIVFAGIANGNATTFQDNQYGVCASLSAGANALTANVVFYNNYNWGQFDSSASVPVSRANASVPFQFRVEIIYDSVSKKVDCKLDGTLACSFTYNGPALGNYFGVNTDGGKQIALDNLVIYSQTATAAPAFTPPGGLYATAQTVSLSSQTSGATIRYTTDGSTPTTTSGTIFSSPVTVNSNSTLKAIAYKSGLATSPVVTALYTIGAGYTISGTITSGSSGLAGVTVSDGVRSATTDASGNYTISSVPNGSYVLTPALANYTLSPATLNVTVNSANLTGNNFAGTYTPLFPLTVVNGSGSGNYTAGTVVHISANPAAAGMAFTSWTGATVANSSVATTTLVMPAGATTVTANYGFIPGVTARGDNPSSEGIDKLTDGNLTTKWLDFSPTSWVNFAYGAPVIWNRYAITSGNDEPNRDPKNWTLKGSNDGTNWTLLDTRTNAAWSARNQTQTFDFTNSTAYAIYRWDITLNNGASIIQASEFTFSRVLSAYQNWLASYGLPTDGTGTGADNADPDRDDVPNLLEYALGGNPASAATAPRPNVQLVNSKLQITFLRARSDVSYIVESSSDLTNWTSVAYTPVATGQAQTVADTVQSYSAQKRFLRLKVTQP